MPDLDIDVRPWVEATERMGANIDQLPFVLSQLLNDGAFKTRQVLVQTTWPSHVTVRNTAFISASLRVEKATKHNLEVSIKDVLGRGHLLDHARGGTVRPFRAKRFAIPSKVMITKTAHGVRVGQRPFELAIRKDVRITPRGMFLGIGGRLHLMYSFASSVQVKKDVPFFEDFNYVMNENMRTGFADVMTKAMETRR